MRPPIRVAVILFSTIVWLAAPASAQTDQSAGTAPSSAAQDKDKDKDQSAAPGTDFETGELNFQVSARPDVASSKFQEYRDVVNGVSSSTSATRVTSGPISSPSPPTTTRSSTASATTGGRCWRSSRPGCGG